MNHKPQLIDLYDELNLILDDLAPTLENLANQPGKGDSVAEYDIIEMFHKASHALWDYMHLRERRTAIVSRSATSGLADAALREASSDRR